MPLIGALPQPITSAPLVLFVYLVLILLLGSALATVLLRNTLYGIGAFAASMVLVALLYLATVQSIAYGTRNIIEALNARGYQISRLYAVGGGTKNPLWLQEHADVTGADIYLPEEPEAVLLGARPPVLGKPGLGLTVTI